MGDRPIVHLERRPVLPDLREFAAETPPCQERVPQVPGQPLILHGYHIGDTHPQEFLAAVTEQRVDGGVGVDETALVVQQPHGIQGVVKKCLEATTAFLDASSVRLRSVTSNEIPPTASMRPSASRAKET